VIKQKAMKAKYNLEETWRKGKTEKGKRRKKKEESNVRL